MNNDSCKIKIAKCSKGRLFRHFSFCVLYFAFCISALTGAVTFAGQTAAPRPPNVLLISADDLRPALGCYGDLLARTPNLDRLASDGVTFRRAYCQQAVCNPSRASALTGLRPDSTRVYDNGRHFREQVPGVVTLPQHFKNHGYHTQAVGKIFHSSWEFAYCGDRLDDAPSWSARSWWPGPRYYHTEEGGRIARQVFLRSPGCGLRTGQMCIHSRLGPQRPVAGTDGAEWVDHFVMGPITEAPDVPDSALYDGQVAERAIQTLRQIKDRPFFLAVGFLRPHIPYVAPKKYWEMHEAGKFEPPTNSRPPEGVPPIAMEVGQSVRTYEGVPLMEPIDEQLSRHMAHGYYATVSYIDAQVGRVIDELERLELSENTIVVFWSDHGFHLGEQGLWNKATNFEAATRVPLIIRAPGIGGHGRTTDALTELVDLYPTLCDLVDIAPPAHLEGTSAAPLLDNSDAPTKSAAFSQYLHPPNIMGYSIRTDRYRLTRWGELGDRRAVAGVVGVELYDYERDPGETRNVAEDPAYTDARAALERQLENP